MPYVSDLVSKLNAVTVSSYSTDDLFVLTKAYYESPVALGNIPKTFLNALKTRLLDAGTTSARDIGLLTKCINLINFGAFNVASSSTIVPSVNSTITPTVSSSDLDFPTFSAVYRPNQQDAFPFTYSGASSLNPGGTITLQPASMNPGDTFGQWYRKGCPFRVGDKLSISFNGYRSAAYYNADSTGYYANNSPVPNTRDYLYTVLNKVGDNTQSPSYTKLTVEDPLSGFVAPGQSTGYALALPVFNFLDDYGAFFTKFGLPTRFRVRMWGAGGGGGCTASYPAKGGGGGSYLEGYVTFDDIRNNPIVVVGCGGCAGDNTTTSPGGGDGQASQFAGLLAMGGKGAGQGNNYSYPGIGGQGAVLNSKVLFSANGGSSRYTGTGSAGGGAAGGPWGSGQDAVDGLGGYGAGTAQAGGSKGGDSVPYSGIWYTPALSGFVGGSGSTSSSVPAGPGAGGYYSGGIFGGGGAPGGGNVPYASQNYGGNAGGGGGGSGASTQGGNGGHGIVIIEWF